MPLLGPRTAEQSPGGEPRQGQRLFSTRSPGSRDEQGQVQAAGLWAGMEGALFLAPPARAGLAVGDADLKLLALHGQGHGVSRSLPCCQLGSTSAFPRRLAALGLSPVSTSLHLRSGWPPGSGAMSPMPQLQQWSGGMWHVG